MKSMSSYVDGYPGYFLTRNLCKFLLNENEFRVSFSTGLIVHC